MMPIEADGLIEWSKQETIKENPAKEPSPKCDFMSKVSPSEEPCQSHYAVGEIDLITVKQSL